MADDAELPDAPEPAASPPGVSARVAGLWHRIRSGEDPLAFGAVVVVLALGAGLVWFWAGARQGGVAGASPSEHTTRVNGERGGAVPGPSPGRERDGATGAADPTAGVAPVPGRRSPPGERDDGAGGGPGPVAPPDGPAVAVHVAGAVLRPGLYHVPTGSRVADAIAAAGGRLARADLDRLNLAARLVDGQKVFVARRGEPVPAEVAGGVGMAGSGAGAGGEAATGPTEPIDLNAADLAALDTLPGVGPATARAILEERARRGGFRSPRDLLRVPGIGESRFARLKNHVRV